MPQRNLKLLLFQTAVLLASTLAWLPRLGGQNTYLDSFDRLLTDSRFGVRGPTEPSGKVAIVEIDSPSIDSLGRWPWRREYLALLIDRVFELGALNVGLDIVFAEAQTDSPKGDRMLAGILEKYRGRITLAWITESLCSQGCASTTDVLPPGGSAIRFSTRQFSDPILNLPAFTQACPNQGFANAVRDADGIIRRSPFFLAQGGRAFPSLPLALAAQATGKESITLANRAESPLDYYGPERTLPHYSAIQILKEEDRSLATVSRPFEGKTVLIGITALAVGDRIATPFSPSVPGVEVQATITDNLLSGRIPASSPLAVLLLAIVLGGILLWQAHRARNETLAMLFPGILVLYAAVDFFLLFPRGVHWPTGILYAHAGFLAVSTLVGRFQQESARRKFLKTAFSRYLAPEVVKTILSRPESLGLSGTRKELSILFCDLRGFTSLSEKLDPVSLSQLLNEYFTLLTEEVFREQGTVDKYIGDALMAFFGAPLDQKDHALRACRAAEAMARAFAAKRDSFRQRFGADLKLGIGINTGLVSVGNMGSQQRLSYTVIGDAVNTASRIEGATKLYGASILCTGATLDSIAAFGGGGPEARELDRVRVKGKSVPVRIMEVGVRAAAAYETAYAHYRDGKFAAAAAGFEALLSENPSDTPSRLLLARCRECLKNPPSVWDGVWDLDTK